jgi:hypothetical protein
MLLGVGPGGKVEAQPPVEGEGGGHLGDHQAEGVEGGHGWLLRSGCERYPVRSPAVRRAASGSAIQASATSAACSTTTSISTRSALANRRST